MKKKERDILEYGRAVLREKYTENTKLVKEDELFTHSETNFENTGGATPLEQGLAFFAHYADMDSEQTIRDWIERWHKYGRDTIEAADTPALRRKHASNEERWRALRIHAMEIVHKSKDLIDAIDKKSWYRAIRLSALLERQVIKCDLLFKSAPQNAERGREAVDSIQKVNELRWNSSERTQLRQQWRSAAAQLRAKHPDWKDGRIAQEVKRLHPSSSVVRTYLREIKKIDSHSIVIPPPTV